MLANLPRLGLLRETFELLRAARAMEQAHPPRGRGVTEFNHFFQAAYQAVVESVVESAAGWPEEQAGDRELVAVLERLTAPFLALWVEHSRTTAAVGAGNAAVGDGLAGAARRSCRATAATCSTPAS